MPSSALRDAMAARVDRGEFPGIVTVAARDDDARIEAIGVTRFGGDVPMDRETPFRIASMTKPIAAAAAMVLAEDDVIDLEEPVHRLLPELAEPRVLVRPDADLDDTVPAYRPITVEDLLTFRFGWGYPGDPQIMKTLPVSRRSDELGLVTGPPDPRTRLDPDEWIRRFGTLPLLFQPGERWLYDTPTHVLGVLLARAAGQPLGDLLADRIFQPLGMTNTGFWLSPERAARLPGQYMTDAATGRMTENTLTGPEVWSRPPVFPSASGGLVSTADDMLAFARMLLAKGVYGGTRLLSEKSVEQMTTNHLTPEQIAGGGTLLNGSGWGFGMGVTVGPDDIADSAGRYGWTGGYGTDWFNDPRERVIGIALCQVTDFLWTGAMTEFAKLAYR